MKVVDTHCDALYKMWRHGGAMRFENADDLQTNLTRLKEGQVAVQCFAVFVDPAIKSSQQFQVALDQIDLFHTEILQKHPMIKQITSWDELDRLQPGEIGALLTLEGVDVIGNDLARLRTLYRLGIRSVGLTWNFANLCADGCWEQRGAGLTRLGEEVVKLNNDYRVWTDVSHLSERSFWDVLALAEYPIASHSNAKAVCDHARNLSDEQATALFEKGGFIGIVFHPPFVKKAETVTVDDVLFHIEHFCALGGVKHIGFGSDFDGIDTFVHGLEDASKYQRFIETLLKYYKEEDVKGFAYENFLNHRPGRTPKEST